jgi:hypothetical protein
MMMQITGEDLGSDHFVLTAEVEMPEVAAAAEGTAAAAPRIPTLLREATSDQWTSYADALGSPFGQWQQELEGLTSLQADPHHHHHGLMQQYPMAFAEDLINPSAGYVPVRTKGNTQKGKDNQKYTYKKKNGKTRGNAKTQVVNART